MISLNLCELEMPPTGEIISLVLGQAAPKSLEKPIFNVCKQKLIKTLIILSFQTSIILLRHYKICA